MGRKQVTIYDALDALILEQGISEQIYNEDIFNDKRMLSKSDFNRILMEQGVTLSQRKMGELFSLLHDLGIFKKANKSEYCFIIYPKLQQLMKKRKGMSTESQIKSQSELKKTLPASITEEVTE